LSTQQPRRKAVPRFIVPTVLIVALGFAPSAGAATVEVTNTGDTGGVGCALRDAIATLEMDANTGGCSASGTDPDTITFSLPTDSTIELNSANPELLIQSPLIIDGPGMNELTIDASFDKRVFHTFATHPDPGDETVEISGLTITGGQAAAEFPDAKGGGILNENGTELILDDVLVEGNRIDLEGSLSAELVLASGGGIASQGALEINDSVVFDNHITAKNTSTIDGAMARAGGVYAEGETIIHQSTISDNSAVASDDDPNFVEATAGIWSNNDLSIDRSTISHNDSDALSPGAGPVEVSYGGIRADGPGNMVLSTVAGNFAGTVNGTDVGGIGDTNGAAQFLIDASTIARNGPESGGEDGTQLRGSGDGFLLQNTIVADPRGAQTNCSGTLDSDGFNVDYSPDGPSCFTPLGASDLTSNPLLAPTSLAAPAGLAANGGPTETIALQPASPAIDRGIDAFVVGDQRGSTRPVDFPGLANAVGGDGTDIGAFEVQVACASEATPGAGCPSTTPPPPAETGQRARALKKCKKKKTKKAKKKCRKKAKRLPV
jgi:hypothetical protein